MAYSMSEYLRSGGRVRSPGGAPFTVSPVHTDRFSALLADLERAGVTIDPAQSGGFNPRNIAGTSIPSQHAFGRAVDVNWRDNARGPARPMEEYIDHDAATPVSPSQPVPAITRIPPQVAREVAERNGFTWGGDWRNPDPMHFEVSRGNLPPVPVQDRSFVAFAGARPAPPSAPASAPASPPPHAATAQPPDPSVGPWQTTVQQEPAMPDANMFSALAKFEPEQPRANQAAMGLLANMPAPTPPQASGWVSNPFQQQRLPRMMQRAQFGLT